MYIHVLTAFLIVLAASVEGGVWHIYMDLLHMDRQLNSGLRLWDLPVVAHGCWK